MPGELKVLRYFAFGFLAMPFLALVFRSGPDHSFVENLRIGFLVSIVACPFFVSIGGLVYLFASQFRLHGLFVFLASLAFFAFSVVMLSPIFSYLNCPQPDIPSPPISSDILLHFKGDDNHSYQCSPYELPDLFSQAYDAGVVLTYNYLSLVSSDDSNDH